MTKSSSSRWLLVSELSYKTQCWNEEALIYIRQTGDTHLLTPLSFRMLEIIDESKGLDSELIIQRLKVKYANNIATEEILHTLQGLKQLALIKEISA